MRLPALPGPRDLTRLLEQALDLLPRAVRLLDQAEAVLVDVRALLARIEATREAADVVVARTEATRADAERAVHDVEAPFARMVALLDAFEPPLLRLHPVLDRLAASTDPREVDAMVALVDQLPVLTRRLETEVLPVLSTLGSVAPDLHDLLDLARELNEILGRLPGLGRVKRKVEEQQAAEAVEPPAPRP